MLPLNSKYYQSLEFERGTFLSPVFPTQALAVMVKLGDRQRPPGRRAFLTFVWEICKSYFQGQFLILQLNSKANEKNVRPPLDRERAEKGKGKEEEGEEEVS